MSSNWFIYTKKADFKAIADKFGIDQVTARILRNRDIVSEKDIELFLHGGISDMNDPKLLPDIYKAAELVKAAIQTKRKMRIVGDYDIDGVCSTAILLKALRKAGANVDARIPDRINDGYGINRRLVEEAVSDGVSFILTCDNGIAAADELKLAKDNDITVVVTDHHNVRKDDNGKDFLPPADAVVDVKREGSKYPTQEICGAVTAWKLIGQVYAALGRDEREWLGYIELAAIATIGDIMPLVGENRIIVKEGLKVLNGGVRPDGSTECGSGNLGLRSLISALDLDGHELSAYHIGFMIGPCINAGGRLESADIALRLFTTEDKNEAMLLAGHLRELNEERKAMTETGVKEGIKAIEEGFLNDKILVVHIPGLHESLAGIVAGRLRETYGRPVIVVTDAKEGLKGSGRSIESYDMFEGLCKASELMTKFGGHKLAAGLSLNADKLDELRKKLNEDALLSDEDLIGKVWIDAAMPIAYINEKLISEIEALAPYGKDFEKPIFAAKDISFSDKRVLGKQKNVLKLRLRDTYGASLDAVMFGDAEKMSRELDGAKKLSILYYPKINEYAGRRSIQIELADIRIS